MIEIENVYENCNESFILDTFYLFQMDHSLYNISRGLTSKLPVVIFIVVPEQLISNISIPSFGTSIINSRGFFVFEGWDSKTSSLGDFGRTWSFFVYFVSR